MLESVSKINKARPHPILVPATHGSHPMAHPRMDARMAFSYPSDELSREFHSYGKSFHILIPQLKIEPRKLLEYHIVNFKSQTIFDRLLSLPETIPEQRVNEAIPQVEAYLRRYFRKKKTVYPSDVAHELGIEYEVVRETFERLSKEDKVQVAHKVAH